MTNPFEGTGAELRTAREALKISRRELAERCGYPSQTRIFNIETKDSWKAGDREKIGEVLAELQADPPHASGTERAGRLQEKLRQNGHALPSQAEPSDYPLVLSYPPEDDEVLEGPETELVGSGSQSPTEDEKVAEPVTQEALPSVSAPVHALCPDCGDYLMSYKHYVTCQEPAAAPPPPSSNGKAAIDVTPSFTTLLNGAPPPAITRSRPLTNSEVAAWNRCRRKWWLAWHRGLVFNHSNPSGPLATGNRIHRALAAWYVPDGAEAQDPRSALERIIQEDWAQVEQDVRLSAGTEDPDTVLARMSTEFTAATELERTIIEGYLQWLEETGSDARLTITDSEQAIMVTVEGEVAGQLVRLELTGKLDVRATRTSDGARLLLDHKSVGNFASPMKTLHMDPQMLHYMLLEALAGNEDQPFAMTALYNMLRKVKRSAQARPPFFQRVEIHHSPIEVESYKKRLLGIGRDTARAARELDEGADPLTVVYPTPNARDCSWDCSFFTICTMFDDGSRVEDAITALYHVEDPLTRYGQQAVQE